MLRGGPISDRRAPWLAALACLAIALPTALRVHAETPDPLFPMVVRMNTYFHHHEVAGVTLDARYDLAPSEVVRLSVTSQLLGYEELYRAYRRKSFRRDIVERADFLLARFDEIASPGSPFEGMLGYALLDAYQATGDARYLDKGRVVIDRLEALPPGETVLNGGLMAAMALAKYHRLTGDDAARQRTEDILDALPPYQNADGSFPHWCQGSEDIHYTAWISMELILIRRMIDHVAIAPMLDRMLTFILGRIDSTGNTRYQEPCDDYPGCTTYYYSIATGCSIDYDTRAFTNELGYTAMLLDEFRHPRYATVMAFFESLENGGTFRDKWDFWPPPEDPYYPWTIADTSVVNMSVIFWSLSSMLSARHARDPYGDVWGPDDEDKEVPATLESPIGDPARAGWTPSPDPGTALAFRVECLRPSGNDAAIRFTLPEPGRAAVTIHDAAGRRVRTLASGWFAAGANEARWDLRDAAGRACPSGIYFARVRTDRNHGYARIPVVR